MLSASKHMRVTDYPTTDEAAEAAIRNLDPATRADIAHFEDLDSKTNGERVELNRQFEADRETKQAHLLALGHQEREISRDKNMEPRRTVTDPQTGEKTYVKFDWKAEAMIPIKEIDERAARNQKKLRKLSASIRPKIIEFLTQYHNVAWRRVDPPNVAEDGVVPLELLERKRAITDLANSEYERVEGAKRTVAECLARAGRDIARRVKLGAPRYGLLFQGGSYNHAGVFNNRNPQAAIQFPKTRSTQAEGFEPAIVDDSIDFDFWADHFCHGGKMAKVILNDIRQFGDDSTAISERDKPARLKAAAAAILQAQREEEAAVRLCEANGIAVARRMEQCPVTVLLNIERETFAPEVADTDHAPGADQEFG